jgi:hypothetical protein
MLAVTTARLQTNVLRILDYNSTIYLALIIACICFTRYIYEVYEINLLSIHPIQTNQPTRCNSFSSLLLDVYVQLNMFRASSRPSSGAQQMQ